MLMDYLIKKILQHPDRDKFFFILDKRYKCPDELTGNFIVIDGSLRERKKVYIQYKKRLTKVFCFANIPPPIKLPVEVYTYLHNPKLLEASANKFNKKYWLLYAKYRVIRYYRKNTDFFVVQTNEMAKKLLGLKLKKKGRCLIIPFYDIEKYEKNKVPFIDKSATDFAFISTPSFHKNYPRLLAAWEDLYEKKITPTLHVTIDNTAPELLHKVKEMQAKGIKIINYGFIDPLSLYNSCAFLIFPSFTESFGLPLIEAVTCNMKVLAPNLAYVKDVIEPSLMFDTYSVQSISAAVVTTLNNELPVSKVVATDDIDKLLALLTE